MRCSLFSNYHFQWGLQSTLGIVRFSSRCTLLTELLFNFWQQHQKCNVLESLRLTLISTPSLRCIDHQASPQTSGITYLVAVCLMQITTIFNPIIEQNRLYMDVIVAVNIFNLLQQKVRKEHISIHVSFFWRFFILTN